MPDIPFNHFSFSDPFDNELKNQNPCKCSWSDLIWAAMTVGKREWSHLVRYGRHSAFELTYRAAIIYANLMEGWGSQICRTVAYDSLDPSEKSAVSYFIGTAMAKLFAERYLGVPWLMHLDVYRDELTPLFAKGKTKPDLVGQNRSGGRIVIEAKGRTNGITASVIKKAKDQTLNLSSISGQSPTLRVALASFFTNGALCVHLEDPVGIGDKTMDLRISRPDFLSQYYAPFFNLLHDETGEKIEKSVENYRFLVKKHEDADLEIGLISSVLEAQKKEYHEDTLAELGFPFSPRRDNLPGVGRDGIMVTLGESWSEKKMLLQPNER